MTEQLTLDGRRTALCPRCTREHCLTRDGRLWVHGPLDRRCRGSRMRPQAARTLGRIARLPPVAPRRRVVGLPLPDPLPEVQPR